MEERLHSHCYEAGKTDGERAKRKVNQSSTEMMSTERASVTEWRQGKRKSRKRECGKRSDL